MKFGKVEPNSSFLTPTRGDHPILDELPPSDEPLMLYAGGTQWGVKSYVGAWYPKGTPANQFLNAYARQFSTVELNATHYRIFPPETFQSWADAVPESFRFLPKIPQSISHYSQLSGADGKLDQFIEGVRALGSSLGSCFIQMPDRFGPSKKDTLFEWIMDWPSDIPLQVELRHPDWFSSDELIDELASMFHANRIGWVITDAPGRRDVLHMAVTHPTVMVRYAGWDGHPLESERLSFWTDTIQRWSEKGVREVYFCVHQPDAILTPETLLEWLPTNRANRVQIPSIPSRMSLF